MTPDPVRVCFLGYELHPPWHEGTRVLTRRFVEAAQTSPNLDATVVSTLGVDAVPASGISVRYVRGSAIGKLAERLGLYPNNTDIVMFARLGLALRRQIARHDSNLVHAGFASHTLFSAVCRLPPSTPFVAHLFGGLEHRELLRAFRTTDRVAAYTTCSPRDVERLRSFGVRDSKIARVPPVVEPIDGDQTAGRTRFGLDADSFVVGYLGNLNDRRFPLPFAKQLNDFASRRDVNVLVVTKDLEEQKRAPEERDKRVLATEVESLDNLTLVAESLSEEDLADAYAAADAWVFPFEFGEGPAPVIDPPLTVLEAMAAGRPVVATRVLSLPELIDDGETGRLVDPGNHDGLIDVLTALADAPEDGQRLGAAARQRVEREFSPETAAAALETVYDRVLERKDA